jgi:hypothetical protein
MTTVVSARPGWQKGLLIGGGILFGLAVIGAISGSPNEEATAARALNVEFIAMPGLDNYAIIFPEGADPVALEDAARAQCYGKQICQVLGWTDKADAAPRLPMLDREMETLAFNYSLNRNTSYERVLYKCERFPTVAKDSCLAE